MKSRTERLLPGGVPRYVRCYDNGGETADRFTIVFTGRYRHQTGGAFWYVGSSAEPTHPQGLYQHGEHASRIDVPTYGHLGKKIAFSALPAKVQACVLSDYRALWDIPVQVHGTLETKE